MVWTVVHHEVPGSFNVSVPPEKVYSFLTDPEKLASVVPDKEGQSVSGDGSLNLTVKVGISFIKGTFNVNVKVSDSKPGESVTITGAGSGKGGAVDFTVNCRIAQEGGGSRVDWDVDLNIRGTIATMGARMIQGQAKKYIDQMIGDMKKSLEVAS